MDSLRLRCQDLRDCDDAESTDLANELEDLEHDLFEASARRDDWTEDLEPTEIGEELFELSAEASMIQSGINARAQVKASSRAAERRRQAFGEFDVSKPDRKLSETQRFDLWDDRDPKNW
jgi:hypothetical protein